MRKYLLITLLLVLGSKLTFAQAQITSQPRDTTVCANNNAAFLIAATSVDSFQWQSNTGSGWNSIVTAGVSPTYSGFQSSNLSLGSVVFLNNGIQYRCIVFVASVPVDTSNSALLTVTSMPVAIFSYTGTPFCNTASSPSPAFSGSGGPGTFTSVPSGLTINSGNGLISLSSSNAGAYTVTNTIAASGGCPAVSASSSITVTALPVATFSYTGTPYCKTASNPSPAYIGGGGPGTFTSMPLGLTINSGNGLVSLSSSSAGSYTVTNTIAASGGCPAVSASSLITVTALPIATFSYTGTPYCNSFPNPSPAFSGGGGPGIFTSTPSGLTINSGNGQVALSSSAAGSYTVTNTISASGGCPSVSAASPISVTALPSATFSYPGSPYCSNSTSTPLPTSIGGGVLGSFTASSLNLTINPSNGQVHIPSSSPGTYTVTNTVAPSGACPSVLSTNTITITQLPSTTFSYPNAPFCSDEPNPLPSFIGAGIAGVFSSNPSALAINTITGLVDLSVSVPGTYTVTNAIPASGGCQAVSSSVPISITALPDASFAYVGNPYCNTLTAVSPSIPSSPFGTFSASPAGLAITGPITGQIDPSSSIPGTYLISRTIAASGACPQVTSSSQVTITELPSADFNYIGSPYCNNGSNPAPVYANGGTAGTFTASAGLSLASANTGEINLGGTAPGTYVVTNDIPATGGCPNVSATDTVTITSLPTATFSYLGSPYCTSGTNPLPSFTGGSLGGVFSSTTGLVFVSTTTGELNLSASTPGTYLVTNTIGAGNGCPTVISTSILEIWGASTSPSSISANAIAICDGDNTQLSQIGGALGTGGNFAWYTGSCGGNLVGSGPSITVAPNSTQTYFVRVEGNCGNTNCASVVITVNYPSTPPTAITGPTASCTGQPAVLTAVGGSLGSGAGYQWYSNGCGGASVGTGASITVSPTSNTTYFVNAVGICNTTTCDSITIGTAVQPSPQIVGPSQVCTNASWVQFCTSPTTDLIHWSAVNGFVMTGQGTNCVRIQWQANAPSGTVIINQHPLGSPNCTGIDSFAVTFSSGLAPSPATVIAHNNNIATNNLVCQFCNFQIYKWGYEAKTNPIEVYTCLGNNWCQFIPIDTINNFYWVYVGDDPNCLTKSYFVPPNIVSVEETNYIESGISIFPNPANGRASVTSEKPIFSFELRSAMGVLVRETAFRGIGQKSFGIDLSGLASGTYFLTVRTKQGILSRKLMVMEP